MRGWKNRRLLPSFWFGTVTRFFSLFGASIQLLAQLDFRRVFGLFRQLFRFNTLDTSLISLVLVVHLRFGTLSELFSYLTAHGLDQSNGARFWTWLASSFRAPSSDSSLCFHYLRFHTTARQLLSQTHHWTSNFALGVDIHISPSPALSAAALSGYLWSYLIGRDA